MLRFNNFFWLAENPLMYCIQDQTNQKIRYETKIFYDIKYLITCDQCLKIILLNNNVWGHLYFPYNTHIIRRLFEVKKFKKK